MSEYSPRALYQAVADAEKQYGELSPEAGLALVNLWEYFDQIKDGHSANNCIKRLGEIILRHPQAAELFPISDLVNGGNHANGNYDSQNPNNERDRSP